MRLIYVTANLPHGTDEAFLIPEIACLRHLGHEVLIVPRSPTGDIVHGTELLNCSQREALLSRNVLQATVMATMTQFGRLTALIQRARTSRSAKISAKNLAVLPKAVWLSGLAAQWEADHIHCHWAGTTATMAMIASQLSGVPWSFTLHRWDIVEDNLLALKARSASMVRFISEDGLRMGRKLGIPEADHIRVLHMGVEMPREPIGPRPAGRIVLCPARLVEVKGHRFLLEAWRTLKNQGVHGELWLAGDGPLHQRLERLAASLGVRSSIRFLGTIPHKRLLEMYEKFGIAAVVLPSVDLGGGCHEGIPVALIEAMSYGIPVVGTRTGGTGELIQAGTGLLVEPADAGALSRAIQSLLGNPEGAQRLGSYGRRYVAQGFDVRRIAAELVSVFEATRRGGSRMAAAFATS
jgi:glycosyltransferase involved in cell wall biosynthesis